MTKTKKTKTKIAIFVISSINHSMGAIALIISGVAKEYPSASTMSIQLVFTLITLLSVVGTLLAGKLAAITTKKKIVIIFSTILCAGGMLGYFAGNSLAMLYVASIVIGLGNGVLIPVSSALVAEHFKGGERASVIGAQSLFVNGGNILINLLGGLLAAKYWKDTYLIFLLTLPVIITTLFLLPEGRIEKAEQGTKIRVVNSYLKKLLIQALVFGICYATLTANVTYYVYELGVGNESQASFITLALAAGGTAIGLVLRHAMKLTGKYCFAAAMASAALSLWIFYFTGSSPNMPLLIMAGLLLGVGLGIFMPSGYTLIPNNVNPAAVTMAISIFTVCFTLGAFLNPYVITLGAGLINDAVSTRFLLAAILQSANLLFSIVAARHGDRKQTEVNG